ncbi:Bacterial alpha-L-rhamnosidase [Rudanella paleaurantiibacter]|uniref:Bacterial alpha-L-rhamnosidase n=1 Tax=Rudanella paleaurantiibacter TaxID=2614655 RepID=A0A7J5TTB3_9BACT|nr:alpha-L-rhamnosidase C-terminal domain-containing protein [Rudanella paleaurantiibacter]KAB7726705.1 Bacterial alpha-L-rhamnosidase [Rudanella paleaurantiibacter]
MKQLFFRAIALFLSLNALAQTTPSAKLPPIFGAEGSRLSQPDPMVRQYLAPVKIVWQTGPITNAEQLLKPGNGQADLSGRNMCSFKSTGQTKPGILLDFGRELHGGLQIVTGQWKVSKPITVRIRFGESVSEAMADIEPKQNATNDHAIRDLVVQVPWLGKLEIGNTGFRFVRIDLVDGDTELLLKEARSMFTYRDIPYLGSFRCNDELLNQIWATGAYTVHLNMQDYLWDGIKRDRLVWVGDMHPEVATINAVFGYNEVVPKSLDLSRDITPLPGWMNGISTYSMWWILIQRDWYQQYGNLDYLDQQKAYLLPLLALLAKKIDDKNSEILDGTRFLDWPSSENKPGIHAGLQAMMVLSLRAGADLCRILNEPATAAQCEAAVARLKTNVPPPNDSKQGAALLALAGLMPPQQANREVLGVGGAKNFSTFYGYYMLQAKAKAGDYKGALANIREFWGGMLKLGATTFWEDFNLDWTTNAARIDELVPAGKKDIHGDCGAYCYIGFRHSLSHGWASGPTPWLTEHVLGISVVEPGCRAIRVTPHLEDLTFVEGTFPTPFGVVRVKHTKRPDGTVQSHITGPKEVRIIR